MTDEPSDPYWQRLASLAEDHHHLKRIAVLPVDDQTQPGEASKVNIQYHSEREA